MSLLHSTGRTGTHIQLLHELHFQPHESLLEGLLRSSHLVQTALQPIRMLLHRPPQLVGAQPDKSCSLSSGQ